MRKSKRLRSDHQPKPSVRFAQEFHLHDHKASPLNTHLGHAQQARKASEAVNLMATCDIFPAGGKHEDVGEGARAGRGAQENEVRGETE